MKKIMSLEVYRTREKVREIDALLEEIQKYFESVEEKLNKLNKK